MPRPPRLDFPGAFHHVTSRANGGSMLYLDEADRGLFFTLLAKVCNRHQWICHAYCQMGNHFHLIVQTPEASLALGMRALNGDYARAFNRRHGRRGHVFGGRYASALIKSEPHLLEASRYVVLNPIRAGLCRRPEEWPWSSYRATAGLDPRAVFLTVDWMLAQFSDDDDLAQRLFGDFVRQGMAERDVVSAFGIRHVPDTGFRQPPRGTRQDSSAPSAPR